MMELNAKITQLELRVEQYIIHLRSIQRTGTDAAAGRAELRQMLQRLRSYKERRESLLNNSGALDFAA
jgi:hypothetical protein